jgi:hypothetical protein
MAATFGPACWLPTWIKFFRLSKYFDRRNYVHPRIMCSAGLCNHTIIRIDGPSRWEQPRAFVHNGRCSLMDSLPPTGEQSVYPFIS